MDELAESRLLAALQRGDLAAVAELLRDDSLITTAGWLVESDQSGTHDLLDGGRWRLAIRDASAVVPPA